MNRAERRKLKKQGKVVPKTEPVYLMKPEDIKNAAISGPAVELIDHEINQQILKKDMEYTLDVDSMILWTLYAHYGWGKKRLMDFYENMFREHLKMREFYEMDELYPERLKLKEKVGIDMEELYKKYFNEDGTFRRGVIKDV